MKLGLFTAWMASVGLVTWRTFSTEKRGPFPSELAATIVVYGTLGLAGGQAETPAAIAGWGLVVAALLNLYNPANPLHRTPPTAQGQAVGNAGSIYPPSSSTQGTVTA